MSLKDEWDKAKSLIGQQVRITLDPDDDFAVVEGQLLSLSEDGEVVVLDDGGTKHYCWPMLKVSEREQHRTHPAEMDRQRHDSP